MSLLGRHWGMVHTGIPAERDVLAECSVPGYGSRWARKAPVDEAPISSVPKFPVIEDVALVLHCSERHIHRDGFVHVFVPEPFVAGLAADQDALVWVCLSLALYIRCSERFLDLVPLLSHRTGLVYELFECIQHQLPDRCKCG
jgi:hypothetical protein